MKTPREVLLAHCCIAEPKIDAIRRAVIAKQFNHEDTKAQGWLAVLVSWGLGGSQVFWRELIFPCRRIWTGLAAIWLLVVIANVSLRDHSPMAMVKSSPSPEMILVYRQQEKLLAELIGPDESQAVEAPKPLLPQPRSERQFEILTT